MSAKTAETPRPDVALKVEKKTNLKNGYRSDTKKTKEYNKEIAKDDILEDDKTSVVVKVVEITINEEGTNNLLDNDWKQMNGHAEPDRDLLVSENNKSISNGNIESTNISDKTLSSSLVDSSSDLINSCEKNLVADKCSSNENSLHTSTSVVSNSLSELNENQSTTVQETVNSCEESCIQADIPLESNTSANETLCSSNQEENIENSIDSESKKSSTSSNVNVAVDSETSSTAATVNSKSVLTVVQSENHKMELTDKTQSVNDVSIEIDNNLDSCENLLHSTDPSEQGNVKNDLLSSNSVHLMTENKDSVGNNSIEVEGSVNHLLQAETDQKQSDDINKELHNQADIPFKSKPSLSETDCSTKQEENVDSNPIDSECKETNNSSNSSDNQLVIVNSEAPSSETPCSIIPKPLPIIEESEANNHHEIESSDKTESVKDVPKEQEDNIDSCENLHSIDTKKEISESSENKEVSDMAKEMEVSSSRSEFNLNEEKGSKLKRTSKTNDKSVEESKKVKLSTNDDGKKNKRKSADTVVSSDKKKIRLSNDDSNNTEEINNTNDNDTNQETEMEASKENNENFNSINTIVEENPPENEEKLCNGEQLNEVIAKETEDINGLDKNISATDKEETCVNSSSSNNDNISSDVVESVVPSNTDVVNGLDKNISATDKDKTEVEVEVGADKSVNSVPVKPCPLCRCDCKIRTTNNSNNCSVADKSKTRTFADILKENEHNSILWWKIADLAGHKIADHAINKSDIGSIRKSSRFLVEEHDRLIQLSVNLKKQLDDAKCIIKRMVDEKIAHKSWSEGIVPLKVTRSVGMQVCTAGSSHVLIRPVDQEKESSSSSFSSTSSASSTTTSSSSTATSSSSTSKSISPIPNGATTTTTKVPPLTQTIKTNNTAINNNKTIRTLGGSSHSNDVTSKESAGTSIPGLANNLVAQDNSRVQQVVNKSAPVQQSSNQGAEVPSCTIDEDLDVQVIETVANGKSADKLNQVVKNVPSVAVSTPPVPSATAPTTAAASNHTPRIYVINTAPVPSGVVAARNTSRQVTAPSTSPASEIIDLTDNDAVGSRNNKIANKSSMNVASRGPSYPNLPPGHPQAKTTINHNGSVINLTAGTKVVAVPADSTTTHMMQRPNSSNGVVRKVVKQPNSGGTEVLLTSMGSLPQLPPTPKYASTVLKPPRPILRICKNSSGIMLSWNFEEHLPTTIRKYQVFAYQEGAQVEGSSKSDIWKKVGDVDALPLPMACTLTQFKEGHKYFFVVRAIDVNLKVGEFSLPGSIMLTCSSSSQQPSAAARV